MKQYILFIFIWFVATSSYAQTIYESPCVVDGKTFQLTIPEGLYRVQNSFLMRREYTSIEFFNNIEDSERSSGLEFDAFIITYKNNDGLSLESLRDELIKGLSESGDEVTVKVMAEIKKVNDREFLVSETTGKFGYLDVNMLYFGVFLFGDRIVIMNYLSTKKELSNFSFEDFISTLSTVEEIETEKTGVEGDTGDELNKYLEELVEKMDLEDEIGENDLFETNLSSYDLMFDEDSNWDESEEGNSHLLEEFIYKNDNGSVQIFSAGAIENYSTTQGKLEALNQVLDPKTKISMKLYTNLTGDSYTYNVYSVVNHKTVHKVYTAEVNGELVFFVLNSGENPAPEFTSAAETFVKLINFDNPPPAKESMPRR